MNIWYLLSELFSILTVSRNEIIFENAFSKCFFLKSLQKIESKELKNFETCFLVSFFDLKIEGCIIFCGTLSP